MAGNEASVSTSSRAAKAASISFLEANGGGGIFAIVVVMSMLVLTGTGFAFGFLIIYGTSANLNPAEEYFGQSNQRWIKWMMPPGEPMFGAAGTCGASVTDHFDGNLLNECPTGCTCHSSYDSVRSRFNACMGNMTRHRAYTPHVDCDGTLAAHHHPELHAFIEGTSDGELCNFISKDAFLASCAARTSYADRRSDYGWTLLVTLGMPFIVWLLLLLLLLCGWRSRLASEFVHACNLAVKSDDHPVVGTLKPRAAESAQIGGQCRTHVDGQSQGGSDMDADEEVGRAHASDKATSAAESTVDHVNTMDAALRGDMQARFALAKEATSKTLSMISRGGKPKEPGACFKRLAAMRDSPWFKFAMWARTHALGVVAQLLAFFSPTAEVILEPMLLAALIALHLTCVPTFYFVGEKLKHTRFVVDTLISIGYIALSFLPFLRVFIEREGATELILEYEELTTWQLLSKCLATVTPLLTLAISVHSYWGERMRSAATAYASKITPAPPTDSLPVKPAPPPPSHAKVPTRLPRLFRLVTVLYLLTSYAIGAYTIAALAQLRPLCGWHRTCADPGCTPATLPYGLSADALPWTNGQNYPNGENFYSQLQLFRIDPGTGREWTWHNRVGFKYTIGFEASDSGVLMNLDMWEQPGYSEMRSVTRRTLPNEAGSAQTLTVQNHQSQGERGRCTMQFAMQCQEEDPTLAFKNSADYNPLKYVKYKSGYWKAVLQAPYPACWTAEASEPESSWWSDMLTFGPNLAVGAAADGGDARLLDVEQLFDDF